MTGLSTLLPEGYRSPGLSTRELDAAQEAAEAVFPADLCELLTEVLPIGDKFPDWRRRPGEAMQTWRDWLTDGIAFDVIHNDLWLDAWGQRPPNQLQARSAVEDLLRDAPALIPIYGHRAIPNEPSGAGNPVFSIVQTDIIVYGRDLGDYFAHDFGPQRERPPIRDDELPTIRFWSELLDPDG